MTSNTLSLPLKWPQSLLRAPFGRYYTELCNSIIRFSLSFIYLVGIIYMSSSYQNGVNSLSIVWNRSHRKQTSRFKSKSEMSGHACPMFARIRVRVRVFRTCPCPNPCPSPCPKSQKLACPCPSLLRTWTRTWTHVRTRVRVRSSLVHIVHKRALTRIMASGIIAYES